MAVLDTPPEEGFDALTRLAAMVCGTPMAIVSLIDGDRLWFKSVFGLDATTIGSAESFCCETANSRTLLHVLNARRDPRFVNNTLVTGERDGPRRVDRDGDDCDGHAPSADRGVQAVLQRPLSRRRRIVGVDLDEAAGQLNIS